MSRTLYSYISIFVVLTLLNVHSVLSLSNTLLNVQHSELSLSNNRDPSIVNCANFTSCGECTSHLQCGFCVTTNQCVQGGWKGPLKDSSICPSWEYQYAQCFVSTKQAIISLASALFGIIFISFLLCLCCCLCQCCKLRNNDEERVALLGDSLATHHFRRASYYNYNRNRPFERRGRTISTGTANSLMQYGRNWRASDDYMYGYGGPTTQSMLWVNDNSGVPTDYSIGSNNNSGEWRRWEKKREELLAKYAKSSNEA